MDQAGRDGVVRVIAWLKRAYHETEHPSLERVAAYVERLHAFGLEELQEAAKACVDTERRFPSIAALVLAVEARRRAVPPFRPPQLEGPRVTQAEARAAIQGVLVKLGGSQRAPEREPGDDDPEAA